MDYSLEKIDTVVACDALLMSAQKKKQDLEIKRRKLGEAIASFRKRMDTVGQDSALVQSMLLIYTAAYEALPEGTRDKVDMKIKVRRLELRQAQLEKRALTYNVRALLSRQVKYNVLDCQVAEIDAYIAAVEDRKTALATAALRVTYTAAIDSGLSEAQTPSPTTPHDVQPPDAEQPVIHLNPETEHTAYIDQYRPAMSNTGQG